MLRNNLIKLPVSKITFNKYLYIFKICNRWAYLCITALYVNISEEGMYDGAVT